MKKPALANFALIIKIRYKMERNSPKVNKIVKFFHVISMTGIPGKNKNFPRLKSHGISPSQELNPNIYT